MALFPATVILAYVVCTVLMIRSTVGQDMSLQGSACNGRGIDPVSDYALARGFALREAVKHTPDIGFNYNGGSRYMSSIAYSHGQCNGGLLPTECERCMEVARNYMIMRCAKNTEGWVKLGNCEIGFWEFPIG